MRKSEIKSLMTMSSARKKLHLRLTEDVATKSVISALQGHAHLSTCIGKLVKTSDIISWPELEIMQSLGTAHRLVASIFITTLFESI